MSSFDLRTINPSTEMGRGYLTQAWEWVHLPGRAKFFPHTGGQSTLENYLKDANCPTVKHFGVFVRDAMVSLITVEAEGHSVYTFHVTSPRKANGQIIADAVYTVGWRIFDQAMAELVYTMVPWINGHQHKGSVAMALSCGLLPTGMPENETINGINYTWIPYQMTREEWTSKHHGKEENTRITV